MPVDADEFFLDPRAVRRAFDRASTTYSEAAVQGEIRARLLERLDVVRLDPAVVLDLGGGDGRGARALKNRYPKASVVTLDQSERMAQASRRQSRFWRRHHTVIGRAERLPVPDASVDLLFSNLMLEWCADPDAVFREARRVLRAGGLFTFTTFGPDTLVEVREAWREVDAHVHVHRFIDMHDLGDALMRARFAEPVMDVERLTVTYSDLRSLWRDLKQSGSGNIAAGRRRTLTGRKRWQALEHSAQRRAAGGPLKTTLEVVYGHAWSGIALEVREDGEVRVPIKQIRRRVSD